MAWERVPEVVSDTVGGKAVLIDAAGVELLTLNRTGSTIWELLSDPRERDDLVDGLAAHHPEVDRARLGADVDAFIRALERDGLVRPTGPTGG